MTIENNKGYKFYREVLKSPKLIVAPMVDQSELPFRELCRKYGAQLCYTPMIAAKSFVQSVKIRQEVLYKCSFDRPLICQFCVNDVDTFLKAIELAKDYCDAIDINLVYRVIQASTPQNIARKGHYGAFLQDDWDLISTMIKQANEKYNFPITCKIRVFDDANRTVEYAKMIEKAGCYLLTIHGRTREMKGQFTGLADWEIIKRVKEAVNIPVFANGNIQRRKDVDDCLEYTKVDGVMSAEGLLYNPALFKSLHVPSWIIIDEYLEICRTTGIVSNVFIKAHLFKMAQQTLQMTEYQHLRKQLYKSFKIEQFQAFSNELRKLFEKDEDQTIPMTNYPLPHYCTQAYFRPANKLPTSDVSSEQKSTNELNSNKHKLDESDEQLKGGEKSTTKKQKTVHISKKSIRKVNTPICSVCLVHQQSLLCDQSACRPCCIAKCFKSEVKLSCEGHRFNVQKVNKKSLEETKTENEVKQVESV